MTRELDVYLDGTLAGSMSMTPSGALSFAYAFGYRSRPNPTPVSMSMPLERESHPNRVVLPFLQGLLPDNAQALAAIASSYGVSASSPFAMIEHIGTDVAGALQFVQSGSEAPDAVHSRSQVKPLLDAEIGRLLVESIEEYRDGRPLSRHDGPGSPSSTGCARSSRPATTA